MNPFFIELLNNPIVQSGVAPFFAALVVAMLFSYFRLSGLAVLAGFSTTVYLIADFDFENLSAIKKIILSGLVVALIAPILDLFAGNRRFVHYLIIIAHLVIGLWVFSTVLQHKAMQDMVIYCLGIAGFMICLAILMDGLSSNSIQAGAAGVGLGLGTGFAALFAASALLGQLGLAIGMAACAYMALQFFSRQLLPCGRTFMFPLSLLCGLIALAAVILAQLPWFSLLALLIIPAVVRLPLPGNWPLRGQIVVLLLYTITVGAIPTALIFYESGGFYI